MRNLALILPLLGLAACSEDKHFPDLVIDSSKVSEDQAHMSIYAVSTETKTEFSVYLHIHHAYGIAQYLTLTGDDELSGSGTNWASQFTEDVLPEPGKNAMLAYYSDAMDSAVAGETVAIDFVRNQSPLLSGSLTLLQDTAMTVTTDPEPISLQSTLSVSWTPAADYDYKLKFYFSCQDENGENISFRLQYPNYQSQSLISPFDLDLNQLSTPPSSATNCQVEVNLVAQQDQSDQQAVVDDNLNVMVSRVQSQTLLIDFPPTN